MRAAAAKYEVVSMVLLWSPVVWDVTLCSLSYMYQRCRGSCPLGVSGMSMKTILKMEAINFPEALVFVCISVGITFPKTAIITSLQLFWNKVDGFFCGPELVAHWNQFGTSSGTECRQSWRVEAKKGGYVSPCKAFPYQHRRCPQLIGLIQWF